MSSWKPGMPSPNPSGLAGPQRMAQRTLAIACRDAASDEEIADWLLTIAIDGEWPEPRAKRKRANATPAPGGSVKLPEVPDGTHRMAALKEFLQRRDGMPMQSVVLKAEIDARARLASAGADTIDVSDMDPMAAAALEVSLKRALAAPFDPDPECGAPAMIDTTATERTP